MCSNYLGATRSLTNSCGAGSSPKTQRRSCPTAPGFATGAYTRTAPCFTASTAPSTCRGSLRPSHGIRPSSLRH
eukprot:5197865-Pyramimonas_sp.AAC.1